MARTFSWAVDWGSLCALRVPHKPCEATGVFENTTLTRTPQAQDVQETMGRIQDLPDHQLFSACQSKGEAIISSWWWYVQQKNHEGSVLGHSNHV